MPTSEFEKKIHRWASLICCFGSCRCLAGVGSICNLLELDLKMPGQDRKHLQLAEIGAADAYYQVDIKNPTTIEVGLFFYVEKEQNVLVDK